MPVLMDDFSVGTLASLEKKRTFVVGKTDKLN